MLTTKDIGKRYRLSAKQVRSLVDAVSPLLADGVARGPHNTILIKEPTLAVFDRAMELRREGASWPAISEQLDRELAKTSNGSMENSLSTNGPAVAQLPSEPQANGANHIEDGATGELLKVLKDQIQELKQDKEFLQDRVKQLEILALPANSERRQRASRWHHLKSVFTG